MTDSPPTQHPKALDAPGSVIMRRWTATARLEDKDEYLHHFVDEVLPALRSTEGFLRAELLRRQKISLIEFTVLTWWESLRAISGFSGDDPTRAVVHRDAQQVLADYDRSVTLHESLVITSQP